jgi:DNA-binding transcriptional LysR family regulator
MELRQLRYFIEIADQGSFTRAAETLSIAQPALTTQVQKLESELRAPLFLRNKRGITLTEVGRAVLDQARNTVDAADATVRIAALAADDEHARLVFGFSAGFPFTVIANLVRGLRRERQTIRIDLREMRSAEQVASLLSGAIDFAFVHDRPDLQLHGLVHVPIAEESLMVAFPAAHRLAGRQSVKVSELAHESFIIPTENFGEAARDEVYAATARAGFMPRIADEVSDIRILLGLVAAGLGVAIVSSAADCMAVEDITFVPIVPKIALHFSVMYRPGFGGKVLAPFLASVQDYAAAPPLAAT